MFLLRTPMAVIWLGREVRCVALGALLNELREGQHSRSRVWQAAAKTPCLWPTWSSRRDRRNCSSQPMRRGHGARKSQGGRAYLISAQHAISFI